jgi:hypothetical protein
MVSKYKGLILCLMLLVAGIVFASDAYAAVTLTSPDPANAPYVYNVGNQVTVQGSVDQGSTTVDVSLEHASTSTTVFTKTVNVNSGQFTAQFTLNEANTVNAASSSPYVYAGSYNLDIVGDQAGDSRTESAIITIENAAPVIGSSLPQHHGEISTYVGGTWTYTMQASDANHDTLQYSYSSATSGFIQNGNVFTFTPTTAGTVTVTFMVTDIPAGGSPITTEQTAVIKVYSEEHDRLLVIDDEPELDEDEAKPGEANGIEIEVKNNLLISSLEHDADDVVVNVEIDDLDLELEEDGINLDYDEDKKINLAFDVPLDAEDGTYDVVVTLEGEDEDGNDHKDVWVVPLTVEREESELYLTDVTASPASTTAGGKTEISATVYNIGTNREDDVYMRLTNTDLDIDITTDMVDKLEETGSDQKHTFSEIIILPRDAAPGTYYFSIKIESEDSSVSDVLDFEITAPSTSGTSSGFTGGDTISDAGGSSGTITARLGQTGKFQTTVTNNENGIRSYSMQLMGVNDWAVASVEPSTITLGPGSAAPVYVYITPKTTARSSETATLGIYSGNALVSTESFDVVIEGATADSADYTDYSHTDVVGRSVSKLDTISVAMLLSSLVVLAFVLYLVKSQGVTKAGPGRPKRA